MDSSSDTLIVTAHPDDETIFFAGLIYLRQKSRVKVLCMTDGNADEEGETREKDFFTALQALGAKGEIIGLPDKYEKRLDIDTMVQRLKAEKCKDVFTHNIAGEYGHPHHQDVSYATHLAFSNKQVMSTAYNSFPEMRVNLSEDQWKQKFKILNSTYWHETKRFIQFLPCSWVEGFQAISLNEVKIVYQFLTGNITIEKLRLTQLAPFRDYLIHLQDHQQRPF